MESGRLGRLGPLAPGPVGEGCPTETASAPIPGKEALSPSPCDLGSLLFLGWRFIQSLLRTGADPRMEQLFTHPLPRQLLFLLKRVTTVKLRSPMAVSGLDFKHVLLKNQRST